MTTRRILISAAILTLCASVAVAQLPVRTVANLPTALCASGELENHLFMVSDGDAEGDVSTGGGSVSVIAVCDAGAWKAGSAPSASGISADGDILIEATGTDHDVALTGTGDVSATATDDILLTAGDDVVIAPTGLLNITPGETAAITTTSGAISLNANGSSVEVSVAAGVITSIGKYVNTPQAVTCTDSGDGAAGAVTITPTSNVILITNADADGCDVTMSETGAVSGTVIYMTVVSNAGTTVNFADTAGVSEIAGAFAAGVWDSISMVYATSTWAELGRSNN